MHRMTFRRRLLAIPLAGLLAGLLAGVPACAAAGAGQSTTTRPVGADFPMSPGTTVRVAGTDLAIRFVRVTDDSRCPKGVRCVTAGDANVVLSLSRSRNQTGGRGQTQREGRTQGAEQMRGREPGGNERGAQGREPRGETGGEDARTVELRVVKAPREVAHRDWRIALVDLAPVPSLAGPIAQSDYVATLRVERPKP